MTTALDMTIRKAAFVQLAEQVALHGDVLLRSVLAQGAPGRGFKPRPKYREKSSSPRGVSRD